MKQIASSHPDPAWRGYTLDELRYERVALQARIETQEEILAAEFDRVRSGNMFLNKNTFSRVLSMINYADFMVLGFKLVRSIIPFFRRK